MTDDEEEIDLDEPEVPDGECRVCGAEDRVSPHTKLCAWCKAHENGRPYGSCLDCKGARAADGSCSCSVSFQRLGYSRKRRV